MKLRPTCHGMAPDKLENGTQCCFNKFDCRLYITKFSQFAFYLSFSRSVISKNLAQPFCKCCNLSVNIALNVRFTTNGMCVMINTCVARTSRNKISKTWDICCCLVPQCEGLCTCRSAFQVTTKWCFDQDVKMVPGSLQPSQKERAIGAVCWKNEGCCCNLSVGVALKVWFSHAQYMKMTRDEHVLGWNLTTFQYIDWFGSYHICLNRICLELMIFVWTSSQLSVQFLDCRLL